MEQIKAYAAIAGFTFLRWLGLVAIALIVSLAGLGCSLFLLSSHVGQSGLPAVLKQEFWACILLIASLALPAFYLLLANRIAFSLALVQVFERQLAPAVGERVADLVGRLLARQAGAGKVLDGVAALRDKLQSQITEDSGLDRLQRRIVRYGLSRARLEDINFQRTDLNLPGVVAGRVIDALKVAAEPNHMPFWVIVAGHVALFAFALIFAQS